MKSLVSHYNGFVHHYELMGLLNYTLIKKKEGFHINGRLILLSPKLYLSVRNWELNPTIVEDAPVAGLDVLEARDQVRVHRGLYRYLRTKKGRCLRKAAKKMFLH